MKLVGRNFDKPTVAILVIPRQAGEVVFKAQAVLDYEPFDKICPMPNPPKGMIPGGQITENVNDPKYKEAVLKWAGKKTDWIVLQALQATEGLTWDTVNDGDSETWGNYRKELKAAYFSDLEIAMVINLVMDSCGLDQDKIKQATDSFLARMAETQ